MRNSAGQNILSPKESPKNIKKYTPLVILIAISPVILWIVLAKILYLSTFAHGKQSENNYSRYKTSIYVSGGNQIDTVYRNNGDADVFVYFHGNMGRLNYILDYLNENTSFIAPAYPGYHRSQGSRNVSDTLVMTAELFAEITKIFGRDIRLHIIGHSLGTQTSAFFVRDLLTSKHRQIRSLSMVAGFPSIHNQCVGILRGLSFLCIVATQSFNAEAYLKILKNYSVKSPPPCKIKVWVYHSPTDKIIPYLDGKKLYRRILLPESTGPGAGGKQFVELSSGTHGNFDIAQVVSNAVGL